MSTSGVLHDIDWSESSHRRVSPSLVLVILGALAILATFLYHNRVVGPGEPLFGYPVGRIDWLWLLSLWLFFVYVILPAALHPSRTYAFLKRFRDRPIGLAAGVSTSTILLVGTFGPLVLPHPEPNFLATNFPPVLTSVPLNVVTDCHNVVGDRCYGTWNHPLGTTASGKDVLLMLVVGARVAVEMSMVVVMLIVPVATGVGIVSAYLGGWVDRSLSGMTETLKAVPALLVFLLWRWLTGDGTLFMLVISFGLFNWGTVADVVRSRGLTEVSKNYVRAAEANGAGTLQVIRWHLIPNISRIALSSAIYQIPLFITIEASLAFLRFGMPPSPLLLTPTSFVAWGEMIGDNIGSFDPYWWRTVMPIGALLVTILSVSVFGHTVQDLIDPRV